MKKTNLLLATFLLTAVATLLPTQWIGAQNEVIVTPLLTPPYSPYLHDYLTMKSAIVMVQNTTNQPQSLKLTGQIEGDNGFFIETSPDYQPATPVNLASFESRTFFGNDNSLDFLDLNNLNTNVSDRKQRRIIRSGILPEGNYNFCVQAVDFNTGAPLSLSAPSGCTFINISFPQPPIVTGPICESSIQERLPVFTWTPPIGNIGGAVLQYDLYILKLEEGQDANYAMKLAVDYNAGNPLIIRGLTITNYQYALYDPLFENGAKYAVLVKVKDLNQQVVFENGGKSEVCTFAVNFSGINPPTPTPLFLLSSSLPKCLSCKTAINNNTVETNPTVVNGTKLQVASFELTVTEATVGAQGLLSGTGTIPVPFLNATLVKIRVEFNNIKVNSDLQVIEGVVTAKKRSDASFIPATDEPDFTGLSLSPGQIGDLSNYFSQQSGQLLQAGQNWLNTIGFEMPIGIETAGHVFAVTGMRFEPSFTTFDAAITIDMPDIPDIIALGGRACITNTSVCDEFILYLAQDMNLNFFSGGGGLTLKGVDNLTMPQDTGTYVAFDAGGFKNFRINAEFTFPVTTLKQPNGMPVVIELIASASEWSDWIASISMNDFVIPGVEDFVFKPGGGWYDHSDTRKIQQIPDTIQEANVLNWHGFYYESIEVQMPDLFDNNSPPTVAAHHLVIGDMGVSVIIAAEDLVDVGQGGGWGFSLDAIFIKFFHSSFIEGGLNGKVKLPITDDQGQNHLGYSGILSYANSDFGYQFTVQPDKDIDVPLWGDATKFTLKNTSNIKISQDTSGFEASATLNGEFTLGIPEPEIDLAKISFQGFKLTTNAPYVILGDITAGLASPEHSVAGFSIGLDDLGLVSKGSSVGLQFSIGLELADNEGVDLGVKTTFSVFGKFEASGPVYDNFYMDSILIHADLSFMQLEGTIIFYHQDPVFGDGFRGDISATFVEAFTLEVHILFGETTFNYWYVEGSFRLENGGITVFPGIDLTGFGGGAYYNMKRTVEDIAIPANNNDPPPEEYVPHESGIGFKASIYAAMTGNKDGFNAKATLEISIENGSLSSITFEGDVNVLGGDYDIEKGPINGHVEAGYYAQEKMFQCSLSVEVDLTIAQITGTFAFLFQDADPDNWYIKIGTPDDRVNITIFDVLQVGAYFEAGNYQIDDFPGLPQGIIDILNKSSGGTFNAEDFAVDRAAFGGSGFAMLNGALVEFDADYDLGPFYASLYLGLGYDVMFFQTTGGCNEYTEIGLGGWYAVGQVYAGVAGAIGVHIDLFFYEGDIEILEIGGAAVLQLGTPNPTWVKGAVGGYFSLFDGLISGNCFFEFQEGDQCIPGGPDYLESLDLIADLYPKPDPGTDVVPGEQEVTVAPGLATNLKMDKNNQIHFAQQMAGEEEPTHRLFRFHQDLVTMELEENAGLLVSLEPSQNDLFALFGIPGEDYGFLHKETDYHFKVTARMEECTDVQKAGNAYVCGCNDDTCWKKAVFLSGDKEGQEFKEERQLHFTTNKGLRRIEEEIVKMTFPIPLFRYFCHTALHDGQAFIELSNFLNYDVHFDVPCENPQTKARFVDIYAPDAVAIETPADWSQGDKIVFDYPPSLTPETHYIIQLMAVCPAPPSNKPGVDVSLEDQAVTTTILEQEYLSKKGYLGIPDDASLDATARNMQLIEAKLALPGYKQELYQIPFRTSSFDHLMLKVANYDYVYADYSVTETQAGGIGFSGESEALVTGTDLNSQNSIREALSQQAGIPINKLAITRLNEIGLDGSEKLDYYDLNDYKKKYKVATNESAPWFTATHPAILYFEHPYIKYFYNSLMDSLFQIFDQGGYVLHKWFNPQDPTQTTSIVLDSTTMEGKFNPPVSPSAFQGSGQISLDPSFISLFSAPVTVSGGQGLKGGQISSQMPGLFPGTAPNLGVSLPLSKPPWKLRFINHYSKKTSGGTVAGMNSVFDNIFGAMNWGVNPPSDTGFNWSLFGQSYDLLFDGIQGFQVNDIQTQTGIQGVGDSSLSFGLPTLNFTGY